MDISQLSLIGLGLLLLIISGFMGFILFGIIFLIKGVIMVFKAIVFVFVGLICYLKGE